jgi:predicted transcriptional regulator
MKTTGQTVLNAMQQWITVRGLAERLQITRTKVQWHLRQLLHEGLIENRPNGRSKEWRRK